MSITVSTVLISSCKSDEDKDSYGLSKITTFPVMTLTNENVIMVVNKGTQYVDPGYSAFVGDDDITSTVTVTGTVNVNTPGYYRLTYTAKNPEGYSVSKLREVIVVAFADATTNDLAGEYTSSVVRYNAGVPANRGPYSQILTKLDANVPGLYIVQDLLGGWYWIGSAYGLAYAYDGIIFVETSGVVSLMWANEHVGWSDGAIFVGKGTYNAGAKQITFSTQMGSVDYMTFNVTLVKK